MNDIQKMSEITEAEINEIAKKYWDAKKLRVSLKTRLVKGKTDRYGSCKETFRRRAVALQGRLTKQMTCIAVFSQKGFLEMPLKLWRKRAIRF